MKKSALTFLFVFLLPAVGVAQIQLPQKPSYLQPQKSSNVMRHKVISKSAKTSEQESALKTSRSSVAKDDGVAPPSAKTDPTIDMRGRVMEKYKALAAGLHDTQTSKMGIQVK